MEKKLNKVLDQNFDTDRDTFVKDTEFVPEMQSRVNRLLFSEASIEKANRVAELSVVLDRLQSYRSGELEELMLIPKKHTGRSLLHFNIVKVSNHSRGYKSGTKLSGKSKTKPENKNS